MTHIGPFSFYMFTPVTNETPVPLTSHTIAFGGAPSRVTTSCGNARNTIMLYHFLYFYIIIPQLAGVLPSWQTRIVTQTLLKWGASFDLLSDERKRECVRWIVGAR